MKRLIVRGKMMSDGRVWAEIYRLDEERVGSMEMTLEQWRRYREEAMLMSEVDEPKYEFHSDFEGSNSPASDPVALEWREEN